MGKLTQRTSKLCRRTSCSSHVLCTQWYGQWC